MELIVRRGDTGKFGFVETFGRYRYLNCGSISMTIGIEHDEDGQSFKLVAPHVWRAGAFVPLAQIEEEMGISKYVRAKKPFYSVLEKGGYIVTLKVGVDYLTGTYLKDKSSYVIYTIRDVIKANDRDDMLKLVSILNVPEVVDKNIHSLMEKIASTKGDREAFLKSRI